MRVANKEIADETQSEERTSTDMVYLNRFEHTHNTHTHTHTHTRVNTQTHSDTQHILEAELIK